MHLDEAFSFPRYTENAFGLILWETFSIIDVLSKLFCCAQWCHMNQNMLGIGLFDICMYDYDIVDNCFCFQLDMY